MKKYFQLHFKLINRRLIDFGLPLIVGYILLLLVFYFGSEYLFSKTEFAKYIYGFVALGFVSRLSEAKRNDFIKSIFGTSAFLKIRMLENLIYAFPFALFLIYKEEFVMSFLLMVSSLLLVIFNFNVNLNFTIPTPFGKKPFEFVTGFRKTFFIFPFAYLLTYAAIDVNNFNLGIFSLLLIGLICLSYYIKPENEYYVWNYSLTPKDFLIEKLKIGLLYYTALSIPILIALGIFFYNEIGILLVFFIISYAYIIAIILAKYSAFPDEMSLPQGILIALSFMFPPILIGLIPYFYSLSVKRLTTLLNDSN